MDFYSLELQHKVMILEGVIGRGKYIGGVSDGMCGEIYIFDQGEGVSPRYICAKLPKLLANVPPADIAQRFVAEMDKQLSFYHHMFVHWAFDFKSVMQVPVALFRYWGSDLDKLIRTCNSSIVEKLSIMLYITEGLRHCQAKGLVSHQDLKPHNIFLRVMKPNYPDLPDFDIYKFPMIADFGLSNAFLDSGIYGGSRPYMAPEQWRETNLSPATDIFALGVIFYQLLTNGYHPVGIKLDEHWPSPAPGNGKKWIRPDAWKKWACNGADIIEIDASAQLLPESISLIKQMLSCEAGDRPDTEIVINTLLNLIRQFSYESYEQIAFLKEYFKSKVTNESLESTWPYLSERWEWFKSEFGKPA
ncbi:MAG: protein kinase [Nitrosomonas sp.]